MHQASSTGDSSEYGTLLHFKDKQVFTNDKMSQDVGRANIARLLYIHAELESFRNCHINHVVPISSVDLKVEPQDSVPSLLRKASEAAQCQHPTSLFFNCPAVPFT